jgi:hypothetical protein
LAGDTALQQKFWRSVLRTLQKPAPYGLQQTGASQFAEITAGKEPAIGCSSVRAKLLAGYRQSRQRPVASSYP